MIKALIVAVLIGLMAISSFTALSPAFAKDMKLPEGATAIAYESIGTGNIAVPAGWPSGGKPPMNGEMQIMAVHVEGGTFGTCDSAVIQVLDPSGTVFAPIILLSTSNTYLDYIKNVLSGLPASLNSKLLSDDVFIVERHGNRISVELKAPQTVYWTKATPPPLVISTLLPTFKFELDQTGGSYHKDSTNSFTGYASSSNYTRVDEEMGFYGNGVFTCDSWGYTNYPMTDCNIVMHGIRTYYPPAK